MKRDLLLVVAVAALAACQEPSAMPTGEASEPAFAVRDNGVVEGRFIVTVRDGENPAAVARGHGVTPTFVYSRVLHGFAGAISDAARNGLLADARVTRIEPDGVASINTIETNATWGLDRIDQRSLPLSSTYAYTATGAGVTAYIIDTGIRYSHTEFGGRAVFGFDALGGNGVDCHGHGTHVSGTVGGATYGVAKQVSLVGVRVLDCNGSGSWSGVIAGMDWVASNHQAGAPAVANMSLGGGASSSVDAALRSMIADGVATAVAAGNGNAGGRAQDACKYSPSRVTEAMTVSATDRTDTKASWANYGNCVDWFAPGVSITSAWGTSNGATNTISGTSMATPHTTGVAALYLQGNPTAGPQAVRDALLAGATAGAVQSSKTANNYLLFTSY